MGIMQKNKFYNIDLPTCIRRLSAAAALALFGIFGLTTLVQAQNVPSLREGDQVVQAELLDEAGEAIALTSPEQATVLTFIFTRCAAMEFCSKMNTQFEALQAHAQADKTLNPRLLSITLDPEFDRPARLKDYGEAIGADPTIWHFATGSTKAIDRLTKAFRVYRDDSEGVLNHTLCTALISPDGTIQKIWRGNAWKVEEVIAALADES